MRAKDVARALDYKFCLRRGWLESGQPEPRPSVLDERHFLRAKEAFKAKLYEGETIAAIEAWPMLENETLARLPVQWRDLSGDIDLLNQREGRPQIYLLGTDGRSITELAVLSFIVERLGIKPPPDLLLIRGFARSKACDDWSFILFDVTAKVRRVFPPSRVADALTVLSEKEPPGRADPETCRSIEGGRHCPHFGHCYPPRRP